MRGWIVPPPKEPEKSSEEFQEERVRKVERLVAEGLLRSERIKQAMLKVPREEFVPRGYRDYSYEEVPFPLPGERATISCPHSYPLFYEPLGLDAGHRFLEIGLGSGYGTALAREVVGSEGLVTAIEIDPDTFAYARSNLERQGYRDIVLVQGDGGWGFPENAPYDRICITAACVGIPEPLIEQLADKGRLIAPLEKQDVQKLTVLEKAGPKLLARVICHVLYVPLRGTFGA